MEPIRTIALGLDLRLTSTEEGGRQTPLHGSHEVASRFTYRPNWGLPGWEDGVQTAAPVLGFSKTQIRPGDGCRAVIVPLFVEEYPEWRHVAPGDVLRMYEGSRICGYGEVQWVEQTTWRMPEEDGDRFTAWLAAV